jgi:anti-sigma B factor antagonist
MASVQMRAPVGGHPVVALGGDLDITGAAAAAAAVTAAAGAGQYLILDLAALEFIDCSGVRALLGAQALARQAGGGMLLAALQDPVLRLVTLLCLAGARGTHASVAAAALSAGPGQAVSTTGQRGWAAASGTG